MEKECAGSPTIYLNPLKHRLFTTMKLVRLALALLLSSLSQFAAEPYTRLLPFQGHLTDATGKPVPDGAKTILFQIYSAPVDGTIQWAGEVHRTTVNGGLVNVLLGAKNPLPRTRTDDPQRPFFDANLYLQIAVDSNNDNRIDASDPPLLPRQSIVSPVFAQESGTAGKLGGFGWSDLLDSGDPRSGKLSGERIKTNSLASEQLKDGAVTTAKLKDGAITTVKLEDGAISGLKLQDGAVSVAALSDGSVTRPKLNAELLTELTKRFTGRPERIVRLTGVEPFTIPTNKWALMKASLNCSYAGMGPGGNVFQDSEVTSHDAYILGGSTVRLEYILQGDFAPATPTSSGFLREALASVRVDGERVAEVRLVAPVGAIVTAFTSIGSASVSLYIYPDE